MEFFESQVGEVRHLIGAPQPGGDSAASIGLNSAHHLDSTASPIHNHQGGSGPGHFGAAVAGGRPSLKRKGSGDGLSPPPDGRGGGTPQQRSKRNRYIAIACNECKRRKIKCNGQTPCQRCGNLNLQCLYAANCCSGSVKDSHEFKQMASQLSELQEQVQTLFENMNSLRSETLRLAPIQDRVLPLPSASSTPSTTSAPTIPSIHKSDLSHLRQQPVFRGPTSTHFSLDVAKNTLHRMGYSNPAETSGVDDSGSTVETPAASPMVISQHSQATPAAPAAPSSSLSLSYSSHHQRQPQDPLWEYDKNEMVRLCRVHESEVGIMYPVVNMEHLVQHAQNMAAWMEAARRNELMSPLGGGLDESSMSDLNTLMLKIIMACALVVEEHGHSERAHRLFESLRPVTDRMLTSDPSDVKLMPLLALTAGYRFLTNDEVLSWRLMGSVARLCIELGLHRRDAVMRIEDEQERKNAIHCFWSAYVLDRRWAFGTGLPWVVPDEDVDPNLPYPDGSPFLSAMIAYSKVCAKVWRLVRNFEPNVGALAETSPEALVDLDRQIKQWYRELPEDNQLEMGGWEELPRFLIPSNAPGRSQREYDMQRNQIWTWLRLNQIRTWLYTPLLHTHSSIMENLALAELVVRLAKNTINYLTHLNNTTNIYRMLQVFYHQFLTSAITVLFLASCHAPVNFSGSCRDEFYRALELVKDLSAKSWVSKRLWATIKSLKEVAPRLGLSEDPHSSAALTMAGLATAGSSSGGGGGGTGSGSNSGAATAATPTPQLAAAAATTTTPTPGPVTGGFPTPGTSTTPVGGSLAVPSTMTTTATATTTTTTSKSPGPQVPNPSPLPAVNGAQISSEMSRIFEGYMGMNGAADVEGGGVGGIHQQQHQPHQQHQQQHQHHQNSQQQQHHHLHQQHMQQQLDEAAVAAAGEGQQPPPGSFGVVGSVYQHFKDMF